MCILNFSLFFFFFNFWFFNSWYFYNETRGGIGTGEILLYRRSVWISVVMDEVLIDNRSIKKLCIISTWIYR